MEIFSAANLPPRFLAKPVGNSRTKQAPKQETDINWIMKKYIKTGLIDHVQRHGAEYGFASSVDFHGAMNIVTKAGQMFDDLPAEIRRRFNGQPAEFLEFVQNPANKVEMIELGLATEVEAIVPVSVVVAPGAESPPLSPEGAPEVVVDP